MHFYDTFFRIRMAKFNRQQLIQLFFYTYAYGVTVSAFKKSTVK